jgi:hypothetical protein
MCCIWSTALYGAETWTLWRVDQRYLKSFEIWYWRRKEKISWAEHVKHEEVLQRLKEGSKFLHTIKRKKANCTGHILLSTCLLKHVTEGRI